MSYIGSTPTTQSFIAGTDYFNGTGSAVSFTMSRAVNSVNDIEVIVNNVEQIPSGYSVSGTTLTFSAAPSAGTSNVYVRYLSTTNLSLAIPAGTSATFNTITATTVNTTSLTTTNGASIQGLTVGKGAGAVATNTAFGANALASNTTGSQAVAVGYQALYLNTGNYSTAVGAFTLDANTTGESNSGFGLAALGANTTGSSNTAVGMQALQANTTASNSTAVGYQAGYSTTTAGRNTLVGQIAGYALTTGGANVVVGDNAFKAATTAENSVAIGTYALAGTTTGNFNTAIGAGAGEAITTGSKNTIIGRYNGNQGSLDIRTSSNRIVLSDGDGNPRVYIDNDGFMGIGTIPVTSITNTTGITLAGPIGYQQQTRDGPMGAYNRTSTNGVVFNFYRQGSGVGSIDVTTTATSYVTSSDYRLKDNIAPMTDALAKVSALKPCTYKWKVDESDGQGFIAHELAEVCPQAVTGEKDGVDKDGKPVYQGVDTSFLVATLTAAIQEQQALITALTTRITALENNNATQ